MDATGVVSLIFFVAAGTSAQGIAPSSSGSVNSGGGANNGTVNLGNQVLAGYTSNNGLFQALSSSQNSANGVAPTLNGYASSSANSGSSDFNMSTAYILANSGANSGGNALTGVLNNLDKSNTSSVGGVSGLGSSQISATGTGININSNANGNAQAQAPTTTPPYCSSGCSTCYGCYCSCYCCNYYYYAPGVAGASGSGTNSSIPVNGASQPAKPKALKLHSPNKNLQQKQAPKSQIRQKHPIQKSVQIKSATGAHAPTGVRKLQSFGHA